MRGRWRRAAAAFGDGGRTSRHLAALTAVALLASACSADADPEPEAAPPPGDESAAGSEPEDEPAPPPPLDAAAAVDRYVRWQQQTLALPPTNPDDLEVVDIGAGIVVPGSPAAEDLADHLRAAAESGVLYRGDVVAEAVEVRHLDDDEATAAVLCVSVDAVETALATGEPTAERDPRVAVYHLVEATYRALDDDWLVASVSTLEGGCVPDAVVAAVTASWEEYIDALVEWLRRGAPENDLGAIADLATDDQQQALRSIPGLDDDARHEREDVNHGLEVLGGTRTSVDTEWCVDPDRNPEAGRYDADGTFTPMADEADRRYEWAQWQLVDGHWRLAHQRSIGPDDPQAPDDHRCF